MKATTIVFVLLVVGVIPAFSQMNRHRKVERSPDQFLQKAGQGYVFGSDTSYAKSNDSWHAWTPYDLKITPREPAPVKGTEPTHSRELTPLLKPEGVFQMRLFNPERKFFMKVYLLDW